MKRILLIGFGRHALKAHLGPIQQSDDIEIAGIVRLSPRRDLGLSQFDPAVKEGIERRLGELRKQGIPVIDVDPFEDCKELVRCTCIRDQNEVDKWFDKWASGGIDGFNEGQPFGKLISDNVEDVENIDGVIVTTFGISHYFYARWAIERGHHTLIDKPITSPAYCSSRRDAAKRIMDDYLNLVGAAHRTGAKVVIGTNRRYSKCFRAIRERIRQAEEMVNFVSCFTSDGWFAQPNGERVYRGADPVISGGGKLMHTGYHWLDIIPWLLKGTVIRDGGTIVRVSSMFGRYAFDADDFGCPDFDARHNVEKNAVIQVALEHGDGKTCLVSYSLLHEGFRNGTGGYGTQNDQEQFNIYQDSLAIWHRRFEYTGHSGRNENETLAAQQNGHSGTTLSTLQPYDSDKTGPTLEFTKCLVEDKQPCISPVEDHAIGVLLLASSYLSAIENRAIQFPIEKCESYLCKYQRDRSLDWLF